MNRPIGVTLIAILDFLAMVFQLGIGIVFLVGMSFMGAFLSGLAAQNGQLSGVDFTRIMAGVGVAFAICAFLFGIVSALIGWGMFTLKNWARIVSMVYSCIGILLFGLGVLLSLVRFQPFRLVWNGGWLVVNGLIVWYLLQPQVKAVFEGRRMAAIA